MAFNYWQTLEEGGVYHIYNRSINKDLIFENDLDYCSFLAKAEKYLSPYLDFYTYCLIPNHFHFLVEVKRITDQTKIRLQAEKSKAAKKLIEGEISINDFLEDQFRRMFSSYAISYNLKYDRHGSLFQKRPKRVSIQNEERQLFMICYIHHNPIHHKQAKDYMDWKYSSYQAFISDIPSIVNRKKVLEWLGDGNVELGRKIFFQNHKDFKLPTLEQWMLD